MRRVHQALFAAILVGMVVLTWLGLTRAKPEAAWLRVEAPAKAIPGTAFGIRVTLNSPSGTLQLTTDLHGWDRRKNALGAISRVSSQPAAATSPHVFELPIPDRLDLATVRAITYLSPTGQWPDQVQAAISAAIPIERDARPRERSLVRLAAYDIVSDPAVPRVELASLRGVVIGLWGVVALGLLWRVKQSSAAAPTGKGPQPLVTGGLLLAACLVAVVNEAVGVEQFLAGFGRNFAREHGLYGVRQAPQQVAVLSTMAAATALAGIALLRSRRRALTLGLIIYFVFAFTAALSLHESDVLLYRTILGVPLEQWGKLAGVALALGSLRAPVTDPRAAGSHRYSSAPPRR